MKNLIQRIIALGIGSTISVLLIVLGNKLMSLVPNSDPEGLILPTILLYPSAFFIGGLVSGLLQPDKTRAALNSLLFSPTILVIPYLWSLLFTTYPLAIVFGALFTWVPCLLGIALRHRKRK